MSQLIVIESLTQEAFAAFGDVTEAPGKPGPTINQGLCGHHLDRARMDFSDGLAGISLIKAEPRELPLTLEMMERHPNGPLAFIPMRMDSFLVIVAEDAGGKPRQPRAFLTAPGQAIDFHKGTWHGAPTPLAALGLFAVVDRIGDGPTLEEHWFDTPYTVELVKAPASAELA